MSALNKLVIAGVILQVAMVVAGHYSTAVLNFSAILGVGIPLVLGAFYGPSAPRFGAAAGGGFLIGIVGAFVGIVLAILMGDQTLMLLTFGPLSSGVTGLLGAVIVHAIRRPAAQAA